jgi:amidase
VQNVTGSPAVSMPLGRTVDGLPIGVQVVAPYGREDRLLSLAYELEEAAPWPTRVSHTASR